MHNFFPKYRFLYALVSFALLLVIVPVVIVFAATVPAEINMRFTPIAIASGGTSTLRISVFNLNGNPLTSATWTDNFPTGMTVADPPNVIQTCGGTVTDGSDGALEAGDTSIKLTNGTVPGQQSNNLPGECYVEVDVTSTTPGNLINTIPADHLSSQTIDPDGGGSVEITNTTPASATINVIGVESPSLSKAFAPNTVFVGETSTLTITITNNDDDYPLTEVTMFDELPTAGNSDILVASPPNASLSGCGEGSGAELTDETGITGSLGTDDTTIKLVNGTIAPGADCVISVDVVSLVQGAYTNQIPTGDPANGSIQTQQGVTNEDAADDSLNVQAFTIDKEFAETRIAAGETTVVTIEIINNATIDYTGAELDDVLPAGLEFVNGSASLSCTGYPTTTPFSYPQADTLSMTNGFLPAQTTCTITATARALTSATVGTYTNDIPIGALTTDQGAINHDSTSADIEVDTLGISKVFTESTIPSGSTSELTITITNPFSKDYTDAAGGDPLLKDVLPAGFEFSTAPAPSLQGVGCTGVLTIGGTNNDTLSWGDGTLAATLPANSSCTITATVRAESGGTPADPGDYLNEIAAGDINTDQGATNASPTSDTITVQSLELTKEFVPSTIPAGGTSVLTISIINNGTDTFTGANLSDTLTNTTFYFTGTPSTTCTSDGSSSSNSSLISLPTSQIISLNNGIVLPSGCTITVEVTTDDNALPSSYLNRIAAGDLTTTEGDSNPADATDRIRVRTVTITKSYGTGTISYPETSTLTIRISNPANGLALTNMTLTDTLPDGLVIASDLGETDTTCNSSSVPILTGTAGTRTISLSNGSMAAGSSSCTIVVEVTVESDTESGNYINTIGQGDLTTGLSGDGPTNGNTNSATLRVEALEVSKEFAYTSFEAGDPSSTNPMTITLTNPTGEDYTDVDLSDTLPTSPDSDLEFVSGTENTDCGGTVSLSGSSPPPYRTITLAGGTIPANDSCIITVDVTTDIGATAGSYTNTIQPANISTTVDGNTGPTVPNNVTADVDTYTLTEGVEATKSFTPSTINYFDYSGNTSTLQLEFTAPPDTDLTNFTFTDVLPVSGDGSVYLANPINASLIGCGASAELTDESGVPASLGSGDTTITMINGTILKGETCTVSVDVTSNSGTTPGVIYTNTITPDDVSNTEDRNPAGDITASLTVTTPSTLTMEKDFDPNIVGPEGRSRLTITLENTDTTSLVDVMLEDVLPGDTSNGVVIASTPNPTTTCGSGVITFPDSQTIQMTGGTIPASDGIVNGICTINVTVQGKTTNGNSPATHTNTIPVGNVVATVAGTPSTMNPQDPASDDLTVRDLDLEIVKGFNPVLVYGGADSVMSITLRNPNDDAELVDITFTDYMPAGDMILVDPPDFDPSDCGPEAVLTRIDESTFEFSGGYLAADEECTITLKANMTVNGNRTNTIPIGAVTTTNGATNKTATAASLTNLASVSVSKSFEPNPVASGLGSYSVLSIEIRTTESVAITGLGLIDTLPPGLQVADYVSGPAPAPTNACGGSLSTPIGSTTIQLTNGNLGVGFSSCTMTIPVTGAEPGDFTNSIPQGAITNDQGITNIPATEDILTLTPYSLGNRVWYDTNNDGIFGAGEVGVSGVRVELYRDTNSNGVYDSGVDAAVVDGGGSARFDVTDGDGYYRFDDLGPEDYLVVIPGVNFTGGNPLAGYYSSGTTQAADGTFSDGIGPDPDDDVDNDDNGKSTFTSMTIDFVSAEAVTLGPNQSEPTDDDDPTTNPETGEASNDQSNRTVDFGFFAMGFASHEKQLTATDQGFTTTPDVAIGEILTYRSTLTVPPGNLASVTLTDTMDRGLVFDECVSITAGSTDLTTSAAADFATICATPPTVTTYPGGSANPADPGRQVIFDFGTLTNAGITDVDLVVTYQAVVLDNLENQSGINLGNQAVWSWIGGALQDSADQVTVREPDLVFSKTVSPSTALAGQEVTFTLTVDHSAATETPAYDVVLSDAIPAGLTYVPGTLQYVSGQIPDTLDDSTAPTLTAVWDQLDNNGTNSVISFNVTLDSSLRRGDRVTNTASLSWTSLPEDNFIPPLSSYNPLSVERDYDPASAVNVYGLEASATVGLPNLPKTGFAPGMVSPIPSQPAEYQYGNLGDIQLVIPALDISLPVLSIPQNDQGWDLSWLWQEAGWLEGTAYPTWTGNTVLTGHAYLASGLPGPFVNLGDLSWGDEIILFANGYRYSYQVRNKALVSGNDLSILGHKDQDWLTLFTCKEYSEVLGDYLYRQVVQAKLLDIQELK